MSRAVSKMRMSWHSYQTPRKLILAQSQSDNGNSSAAGARRGRRLGYPRKTPLIWWSCIPFVHPSLSGLCGDCMRSSKGPADGWGQLKSFNRDLPYSLAVISKSYIISFEEFSRCICEVPLIALYSIVGTQRMKLPLIIYVYVKFPVSSGQIAYFACSIL